MTLPIPPIALAQHIAVLGKTGSGKTSTGKLIIEHVVKTGSRVCVLDPLKSDWWGLISSADGKRPGLPFNILGGPHGHVPLHHHAGKAVAEVVANGALPLSIIDMSEFPPGGQSRFFADFAPVLMRRMRGVLYLVLEEAHIFAPKERSGMSEENMSIHWAKVLATAGRTKGVRLLVLTQRTQALHNAVLGSCETLIAHRMTQPADQEQVIKWLKANVKDRELRAQIEDSLSNLRTGTGWLCSGEAGLFQRVEFPRIQTYDNTATPESDDEEICVQSAVVDRDKLRALIGHAIEEAEASDPKLLKQRIADLERQLQNRPAGASSEELQAAEERGYSRGQQDARREAAQQLSALRESLCGLVRDTCEQLSAPASLPTSKSAAPIHRAEAEERDLTKGFTPRRESIPKVNGAADRVPVEQRVLNALAELHAMGAAEPDRELLAFMAGYSHVNSKGFTAAIKALLDAGHITYPRPGVVKIADSGRAISAPPATPRTSRELQERIVRMLGGASGKVLQPLIDAYPKAMQRAELVEAAGYGHVNSKGFTEAISRLKALGFIDYPDRGTVAAKPVLFLE